MFELKRRGTVVLAVGWMLGGWMLGGCASLPEISRTQAVHDVQVQDGLSPDHLFAAPGDEIRWVNLRKEAVFVQIADLEKDDLACQRGFEDWRGALLESIEIEPNETVSLCFKEPGQIRYNVRAETSVGGGQAVYPGRLRIESLDASVSSGYVH